MTFSKISFSNKGQSLVGIIIVLVAVGLLTGGLCYYLSKRISGVPQSPEVPQIETPEVVEEEPVTDQPEPTTDQPEEESTKECFIGGCSGELCTDNPEAISTCEFLPGMECLAEEMSCQLAEGECSWVLSEKAAECFLEVKERRGDEVTESRIGYLFDEAENLLSK